MMHNVTEVDLKGAFKSLHEDEIVVQDGHVRLSRNRNKGWGPVNVGVHYV